MCGQNRYASAELKNDAEVVNAALAINPEAVEFASRAQQERHYRKRLFKGKVLARQPSSRPVLLAASDRLEVSDL